METDRVSPHLDDSALLHLVDEDAHPLRAGAWGEHVRACEECRSRLETRRRESDRVRTALTDLQLPTDFPSAQATIEAARARVKPARPTPNARWLGSWPRAAAAIVILLSALAVVPSVRAAIVEWIRQAWELVTPSSTAPVDSAPPAVAESGFTISFTPATAALRIAIDRSQAAGELVVVRGDGVEGSLTVEDASVEALVTEDGLRIRNQSSSSASLRLTVPAALQELVVQIGNGPVRTLTAQEMDAGLTTPLR
jgi:hypothetical protein